VVDVDVAFRHALDVVAEFLDQQFRRILIDGVFSVTIMPILNSALTRSAAFSAMRLASSCTVIARARSRRAPAFRGWLCPPK
jgi:hypothetical protein